MKRIHKAYKDSHKAETQVFTAADIATMTADVSGDGISKILESAQIDEPVEGQGSSATAGEYNAKEGDMIKSGKKSDPEFYMKSDSVLRSYKGEMQKPRNCPFKDYNAFLTTTEFEHWRPYFFEDGHDRILMETSKALVAHICTAQSRKELRVRHGSIPLGKFIRAKREQITPLALVLHELKLWAVHTLRTADIMSESTHKMISKRILYVEKLQKKEIWGAAKGSMKQGMRPIAHDKLFRLLLTTREDLGRARDFAFRGFSPEKKPREAG